MKRIDRSMIVDQLLPGALYVLTTMTLLLFLLEIFGRSVFRNFTLIDCKKLLRVLKMLSLTIVVVMLFIISLEYASIF